MTILNQKQWNFSCLYNLRIYSCKENKICGINWWNQNHLGDFSWTVFHLSLYFFIQHLNRRFVFVLFYFLTNFYLFSLLLNCKLNGHLFWCSSISINFNNLYTVMQNIFFFKQNLYLFSFNFFPFFLPLQFERKKERQCVTQQTIQLTNF